MRSGQTAVALVLTILLALCREFKLSPSSLPGQRACLMFECPVLEVAPFVSLLFSSYYSANSHPSGRIPHISGHIAKEDHSEPPWKVRFSLWYEHGTGRIRLFEKTFSSKQRDTSDKSSLDSFYYNTYIHTLASVLLLVSVAWEGPIWGLSKGGRFDKLALDDVAAARSQDCGRRRQIQRKSSSGASIDESLGSLVYSSCNWLLAINRSIVWKR